MKKNFTNILIILMFCAGVSLLLYPAISKQYNAWLQSKVITEYTTQVEELDDQTYKKCLKEARKYNKKLRKIDGNFHLPDDLKEAYKEMLSIHKGDVMAYIEIPSINISLPIAHGTEKKTLENSVGHLEWSSLPVGGKGTHAVLSAHRGLPSTELFTNIDHLEIGDKFYIHVLGETLVYIVDSIAVVEPNDYTLLYPDDEMDYVTLFTCTPYGVNSHRLLVRGVRAETVNNGMGTLIVRNEVTEIGLMYVIPVVLAILAIPIFVISFWDGTRKSYQDKEEKRHEKE